MAIHMNARYKLTKHPNTPIGITRDSDFWTKEITVEWEDPNLQPRRQRYPEEAFVNGTFEFVGYREKVSLYDGYVGDYDHDMGCNHVWIVYTGLKEVDEFCKKCNTKRAIKDENEDIS